MENLEYYKELIALIEDKHTEVSFKQLYKKYFGKQPSTAIIIEYKNQIAAEEDYTEETSYEESYEQSY